MIYRNMKNSSVAQRKRVLWNGDFAKEKPLAIQKNFGDHQDEGRAIILEYEKFYLITVYVPNAQDQLKRIDYRMKWEEDFQPLLKSWMTKNLSLSAEI